MRFARCFLIFLIVVVIYLEDLIANRASRDRPHGVDHFVHAQGCVDDILQVQSKAIPINYLCKQKHHHKRNTCRHVSSAHTQMIDIFISKLQLTKAVLL